jgi:hypothetical protein
MAEMVVTPGMYALLKFRYHVMLKFLINYVVNCLLRYILYLSRPGLGLIIHNGARNGLFKPKKNLPKIRSHLIFAT